MVRGAAVYCRISDDREGAGLGVKRQEEDCVDLAERKGWPVAQVFTDNDVGAYTKTTRPAYRAMLDAIEAGTVDAVIVWHLDRLTRRPAELEEFFEVCDAANVKDLASCTGDTDLSTHDGRFMARILGAVARKESDDKSRRTARKHLEIAKAGRPAGGPRAFGFEPNGVTHRPDEVALVREAAARILSGETVHSVCVDWLERGIRGPHGGTIAQTTIARILRAPRTAGLRSLGGEIFADAIWEPLVDRPTWERVCAALDNRRLMLAPARRYLLTGFLYCGKCGTRMVAQPRQHANPTYTCPSHPEKGGCGGVRVATYKIEGHVIAGVLHVLQSPQLAAAIADADDPETVGITDDIAGVDRELDALADDYAGGAVSRRQFYAASARLESRRDDLHGRLARMQSRTVVAGMDGITDDEWFDLGLDRQRAVIAALIERIAVHPATRGRNTPSEDRVRVTWRA